MRTTATQSCNSSAIMKFGVLNKTHWMRMFPVLLSTQ